MSSPREIKEEKPSFVKHTSINETPMGQWIPIMERLDGQRGVFSYYLHNLKTGEKIALPATTASVHGLGEEKMLCVEMQRSESDPLVINVTIKIAALDKKPTDKKSDDFSRIRLIHKYEIIEYKNTENVVPTFTVSVSPDNTQAVLWLGTINASINTKFVCAHLYLIDITGMKMMHEPFTNVSSVIFASSSRWIMYDVIGGDGFRFLGNDNRVAVTFVNWMSDGSTKACRFSFDNCSIRSCFPSPCAKYMFTENDRRVYSIYDLSLLNFPERILRHLYTFPPNIRIKHHLWLDEGMVFTYDLIGDTEHTNGIAMLDIASKEIKQVRPRCSSSPALLSFRIHRMDDNLLIESERMVANAEEKNEKKQHRLEVVPLGGSKLKCGMKQQMARFMQFFFPKELSNLVYEYAYGSFGKSPEVEQARFRLAIVLSEEEEEAVRNFRRVTAPVIFGYKDFNHAGLFQDKHTQKKIAIQQLRVNLRNKTENMSYLDCATTTLTQLCTKKSARNVFSTEILNCISELDELVAKENAESLRKAVP